MHVVATSALPIDLAALVTAALPGTTVDVPAEGHVGIDHVELANADALVCLLLDRIDARVLDRAPELKVVANCAVGVDNLDLAALAARNIVVANTPDVLTEATAELAFTLMLAAARRLGEGERLVRAGQWHGWGLDQLLGQSMLGKTLGIVGFGRIGHAMARRAYGFGMRVVYASAPSSSGSSSSVPSSSVPSSSVPSSSVPSSSVPSSSVPSSSVASSSVPSSSVASSSGPSSSGPSSSGPSSSDPSSSGVFSQFDVRQVAQRVELDALFATADVVSLHCPLTPDTRNLVDARRLSSMKPTAVLVNTARGGCVDEAALAEALDRGQLFAAGLDVYSREPEIHPRLRASERVVLAPHIGSATTEARTQMARLCVDAVIAVLSGRRPSNVVERS